MNFNGYTDENLIVARQDVIDASAATRKLIGWTLMMRPAQLDELRTAVDFFDAMNENILDEMLRRRSKAS